MESVVGCGKERAIQVLSIVIPIFNEEMNIRKLCEEINQVVSTQSGLENLTIEVILVDDGSTDSSWEIIEDLARNDSRFKGIRFRRNYGKAVSLNHAFAVSQGHYIVTLDGDLQDNPKEIPRLMAKLREGFDLVCGWKKDRKDPLNKVVASRLFNYFVTKTTGLRLHDHNCGLKAYRKEVTQNMALYGELHRFITILAHSRGYSIAEIDVDHRERVYGKSKYGSIRVFRGLMDFLTIRFLTVYENRPLHIFGGTGLILLFLGTLGLLYLAILWVLGYRPIGTRPLLLYSTAAFLFGGQLLSFGFIAELITWKFHQHGTMQPSVAKTVGFAIPPSN